MTESLTADTHDQKLAKRQTFGIVTILLASLLFALAYYLTITPAISGDIEIRGKEYTPPTELEHPKKDGSPLNLKNEKKQHNSTQAETNRMPLKEVHHVSEKATSKSEFDVLPIQDPTILDPSNSQESSDQQNKRISKLDAQLEQEAYDTGWAAAVESQTWDIFYNSDLLDSEITNIDCRTSLCKIVFEHQDESALNNFKNELVRHIKLGKGEVYFSQTPQGKFNTIVYRKR